MIPVRRGLAILHEDGLEEFLRRSVGYLTDDTTTFRVETALFELWYDNYAAIEPRQQVSIPVELLQTATSQEGPAFDPTEFLGTIALGYWDQSPTALSTTRAGKTTRTASNLPTPKRLQEHLQTIASSPVKQVDLGEQFDIPALKGVEEYPPTVNITRDGNAQVNSGYHQISMAVRQMAGTLPVRVAVRHRRWQHFRDQIKYYNSRYLDAEAAYNQIPHFDYSTRTRHDSQRRFELMTEAVDTTGTLLDIGSHMDGYFCHQFEDRGFDCYAVENDEIRAWFLRRLREMNGKQFTVINEDITESNILDNRFTVCLALNVFHHFLKSESSYEALLDVLNRLDTDCLFFQAHTKSYIESYEARGGTYYKRFVEEEFADFVADEAGFSAVKLLGRPDDDDRPLYKLT